jgi:hypothetical protein
VGVSVGKGGVVGVGGGVGLGVGVEAVGGAGVGVMTAQASVRGRRSVNKARVRNLIGIGLSL